MGNINFATVLLGSSEVELLYAVASKMQHAKLASLIGIRSHYQGKPLVVGNPSPALLGL